jgi:ATP phosphoribosyltransferase regulatory subunit
LFRDNHFEVSVDLADLRGYHYHSGVVCSAYVPGMGGAVALGGRYDEVGKAFGRARAATGFSMDLRVLVRAVSCPEEAGAIAAPYGEGEALAAEIARLRAAGEVVIQALPGARDGELCTRQLARERGGWVVRNKV